MTKSNHKPVCPRMMYNALQLFSVVWKPISNINSEKKFRSLFPVSKFLLSRYFEIVSRYFEIAYLFPVSKFLLSNYYEITSLFPVSIFYNLVILR